MFINSCDFNYLRQLVRQYSSMVLDSDKAYLAELRLAPLVAKMKLNSLGELISKLQTQPLSRLHIEVVEAMLLTETSFFRDGYPFEAIAKFILPQLISNQRGKRSLNVWCAACSSGQEPYSLAMLLCEHFPEVAHGQVQLLATDLSSKMLDRARGGRYSQVEIARGLPKQLLINYFHNSGYEWQLKDCIREMVEFRQMNLVTDSLTQSFFDIIFLRNVLIYFDVETKKKVLDKVKQVLSPHGYLFLGSGETTLNLDDSFQQLQFNKAVFYKLRS
ncbi:MAG: protein-glutamate O-methyltransferase CheR [Oscillatoria sp. PMC 1051.18]|nr:protein-glutamate O-methyltransferase CheR [Oscillatoria sp. PMC 1050.18]MEC5029116.1 protein-glutamate O-methyltransferase CheR [Oscillatoria sp. PMC 1051.18]